MAAERRSTLRFTDLPAELRNQIYFNAISGDSEFDLSKDLTDPLDFQPSITFRALRQVSRSVRSEASGIYFSEICFRCYIDTPDEWNSEQETPFQNWLRIWGRLAVPNIRHLRLYWRNASYRPPIPSPFRDLEARVGASIRYWPAVYPLRSRARRDSKRLRICGLHLEFLRPEDGELTMTPRRLGALYKALGEYFTELGTAKADQRIAQLCDVGGEWCPKGEGPIWRFHTMGATEEGQSIPRFRPWVASVLT